MNMIDRYNISNDGSIFTVGEDGTIHIVGKIGPQGNIQGKRANNSTGVLWFFLVVAVIGIIIMGVHLVNTMNELTDNTVRIYERDREIATLNKRISEKDREISGMLGLRSELSQLQGKFDDLRDKFPLKITSIEMGHKNSNGEKTYGNILYSSRITYLNPKIYFTNYLKAGKTFNFTINYYDATGHLKYNAANGRGQTYNGYISTSAKEYELSGLGNASVGNWAAGAYTVEIWLDDVCLGSKKFTIY